MFSNPFKRKEIPKDVVRPSQGPPDVVYSADNAENLAEQIQGEELLLDKVPVGATIEVSTDNTTYSFKKEEEDLYAISATPAKHWIRNGVTKVFIIGALPGGGAVVENGIIRTGAGVEYRFSEGGKMLASTISPVRFVKISYKKSEDEKK